MILAHRQGSQQAKTNLEIPAHRRAHVHSKEPQVPLCSWPGSCNKDWVGESSLVQVSTRNRYLREAWHMEATLLKLSSNIPVGGVGIESTKGILIGTESNN